MFKKAPLAAALMGLAVTATPVLADSVAVQYKDLDLSTAVGRETLDRRIDAAARQVCGYDTIVTGTRLRSPSSLNCYKQARTQVQKQVASAVGTASNAQIGG